MAFKRYNPNTEQWEYLLVGYGQTIPDPDNESAGRFLSTDGDGKYALSDYATVEAYLYNLNSDRLHIGNTENWSAQGSSIYSIGVGAANGADVTNLIAIGEGAGAGSTGNNSIYIGQGAGQDNNDAYRFVLAITDVNPEPLIEGNFFDGVVNIPGSLSVTGALTVNGVDVALITDTNGYFYDESLDALYIGPYVDNWSFYNSSSKIYSIGGFAAQNQTGEAVIAIGAEHEGSNSLELISAAAQFNSGNLVIAIGFGAGSNNYGDDVSLLGPFTGAYNAGNRVVGIGFDALSSNTGTETVGIGSGAGFNNTGLRTTAIGHQAAHDNERSNTVAIGTFTGYSNKGDALTAVGIDAGWNNAGDNVVALGRESGGENTASDLISIGRQAGNKNTGNSSIAIGVEAGEENTGSGMVALGQFAAAENTANNIISIGTMSGIYNSGLNSIMVGESAGMNNTGSQSLLLGVTAGRDNQGDNVITIGYMAGIGNTGNRSIIIGDEAGQSNTEDYRFILSHYSDPLIEGRFDEGWVNIPGRIYRQQEQLVTEEDIRWSMIRQGRTELLEQKPTFQIDFRTGEHKRYNPQVHETLPYSIDFLLSYSRASPAWFWNYLGDLEAVEENEIRPWLDPLTGEHLGMLSEYESANLIPNSSAFDNATGWIYENIDVSEPLGDVELGVLSPVEISDTDSGGLSTTYYLYEPTVFFQDNDPQMRYAIVRYNNSATRIFITSHNSGVLTVNTYLLVDLENQMIVNSGSAVVSSGIDTLKDGWMLVWYRCSSSVNTDDKSLAIGIAPDHLSAVSTATDLEYVGASPARKFQLAHVQAEKNIRATTPIITTGVSAARSADLFEIDLTNLSWFSEQQGTFFIQQQLNPLNVDGEDATVNNDLLMGDAEETVNYNIERTNDAWQANLATTSIQITDIDSGFDPMQQGKIRFSLGWQAHSNVTRFAINGHAQETNSAPTVGDIPSTLKFHSEDIQKGLISIVYIPQLLTLSQYEQLTALQIHPLLNS